MFTIQITDTNQDIEINGKTYVLVEKTQAVALLTECENLRAKCQTQDLDVAQLKKVILEVIKVLGLVDETGKADEAILSGEKNFVKPILKSLTRVMKLLAMSGVSPGSKKELEDTFAFIKDLLPILKKHGAA